MLSPLKGGSGLSAKSTQKPLSIPRCLWPHGPRTSKNSDRCLWGICFMKAFLIWSQSLMLGIAFWLYLLLFVWLCWHWGLKRPSVPPVYYERWLESWFGGESFITYRYWVLQGSAFRDLAVKARFILYSNDHKTQALSNPEKCWRNIQCLHLHQHVLECT